VTTVLVSVGSNVDRERNVASGLAALEERFGPIRRSPVYQASAVGFEGADFHNLVVAFDTDEPGDAVVAALHGIEDRHGRTRGGPRFASRTLALDVLLYGALVRHDEVVNIPRPDITRHAFVLRPMADLVPRKRHPELGVTFAELWERFDDSSQRLWQVEPGGEEA